MASGPLSLLHPGASRGRRSFPGCCHLMAGMATAKQQLNGAWWPPPGIIPSAKPSSSASKAARVPWCLENRQVTDDPGPAPYIQHQLIAHPVQDQLHSSNPNQLLIPKPSFLPPMSLSSPQPFAGCSSEPVSAGRRRLLPRGGEEMCNRGTDPGTTRTFPLISRVRAANKATELSRMSPGHNPST